MNFIPCRNQWCFPALIAVLAVCVIPARRAVAAPPRILVIETRANAFYAAAAEGFRHGLKKRGYDAPGQVRIDTIALTGNAGEDKKMIREQLNNNNALIVPLGTDALIQVAAESPSAPVLFSMILDPISLGLVKALDNPGGNFTGTTLLISPGKQIDALLQSVPQTHRIGVLYTDGNQISLNFLDKAAQDAKRLNVEIVPSPVTDGKSTGKQALTQLTGKVDALWIIPDPASAGAQATADTLEFAARNHLPVLGTSNGHVHAGALLALSGDIGDLGDVTAEMAAQILDGTAAPATMRVRGPRQTVLSVNLDAARALGITIPDSVLHLANEVIDSKAAESE